MTEVVHTTTAPVTTTTGVVRTSGYTTSAYPTEYRSSSYTTAPVERVIRSDISPARYSTTTLANAEYSTSAYPTRTDTTSVPHETVVHRSPVRTEYVGHRVVNDASVVQHRVIEGRAATHDENRDSYNWATNHRDGRQTVGEVSRLLNVPVEELTTHYPQYRGLRAEDPAPGTHGFYTRDWRAAPAPVVVEKKIAPLPKPVDYTPFYKQENDARAAVMGQFIADRQAIGTQEMKERIALAQPKKRDFTGLAPFVGFGLTESDATKGQGFLPVETIWQNGPAWDAGMRIGDHVQCIGQSNDSINSLQQVQQKLMKEAKVGQPLRVVANRNGAVKEMSVVPKTTNKAAAEKGWNDIFFDTRRNEKLGQSSATVKV